MNSMTVFTRRQEDPLVEVMHHLHHLQDLLLEEETEHLLHLQDLCQVVEVDLSQDLPQEVAADLQDLPQLMVDLNQDPHQEVVAL